MMAKPKTLLNASLPDRGDGIIRRETLLQVAEFVAWVHDKKPEVFREAMNELKSRDVINVFENHVAKWR